MDSLPQNQRSTTFRLNAFSLMELLVVMGIMSVLGGMLIPVASRISRGYQLSATSQRFVGELMMARQNALTKGASVQVRVYKLPDYNQSETNATPMVYRAVQSFLEEDTITSSGTSSILTPLGKPLFFSSPIQVFNDNTRSTLLTLTETAGDRAIPRFNKNYQFVSFRFRPNGQTDLVNTANCISLIIQRDTIKSNGFPSNFVTIKIDTPNGTVQTYQP